MKIILFAIFTYLIGSIPSGIWIGKAFKNIDIREHGSKNTGATNAYRILGPFYGILILLLDALKGYLPLYLASKSGIDSFWIAILGAIAIAAHSLSIFLNFKGGKGVATSLGVFLFLEPRVILIILIAFVLVVLLTKYISLASIVASILLPILTFFNEISKETPNKALIVVSLIVGVFVVYKHKGNIKRIINKTESKFKI